MSPRVFTTSLLALALLSAALAWAQTPIRPEQPASGQSGAERQRKAEADVATISIDTSEVLLPVTVRDAAGQFVPSLKAEDFTIYEDGLPQPISSFALKHLPVNVVLLIDTSSSVERELEDFKEAAYRFASRLEAQDQISVIKFDDRVELVLDWTTNRAALNRALKRLTPGLFTKFHEALWLTAREQLSRVTGRKAVIVFTDGIDSGRGQISAEQAFRSLVEEETAVYVVSKTRIQSQAEQRELAFYQNASASARAFNQVRIEGLKMSLAALAASEDNLTRIAEETGGRIFLPSSFDELGDAYQQVADELRSQYVISYAPTNAARDGRYRAIRIKLKNPAYHATSRFGYYAR
jgi:Ca-activated chloride channel family protein